MAFLLAVQVMPQPKVGAEPFASLENAEIGRNDTRERGEALREIRIVVHPEASTPPPPMRSDAP